MALRIGTLAEKSLHAQLKQLYAQPGDLFEYALDGYVIDIARPPGAGSAEEHRCIEIQTRNLSAMKAKLGVLLARRPVHVVFPIAQQCTIARMDAQGAIISRRRSPKHGSVYHIFPELVGLPSLIHHPHFTLEVLLIAEEQVWRDDGLGSWRRRRWSIYDRRLLAPLSATVLARPQDFGALLPPELPDPFTAKGLAAAIAQPQRLGQKMAYCLRQMGVVAVVGKQGNALLYARTSAS
jgi:hypothetical protein